MADSDWPSSLERLMRGLDFFSIIGTQELTTVRCGERGLRPIYLLREDNLFPPLYGKKITINNEPLKYYETYYSLIADGADSENYQHLYSALKSNKPVVAAVYLNDYTLDNKYPQIEVVINTSILDAADKIIEDNAYAESIKINNEVIRRFWIAGLVTFVMLFCLALGFIRISRKVKKPLSRLYYWASRLSACILTFVHKFNSKESSIIKTDGLKPYSVADELLKWSQLKDAGIVSEEEFQEARKKIMGK